MTASEQKLRAVKNIKLDNIRANKGSGKKPTKAILKEEKKD